MGNDVGIDVGILDGYNVGWYVGVDDGKRVGSNDGGNVGWLVGGEVGDHDGVTDGAAVGEDDPIHSINTWNVPDALEWLHWIFKSFNGGKYVVEVCDKIEATS